MRFLEDEAVVGSGASLGVLVIGAVTDRDVTEEADREGPNLDATRADRSINLFVSYLASLTSEKFDRKRLVASHSHRMYCSISLSLSVSSRFGGGGWRNSFGL